MRAHEFITEECSMGAMGAGFVAGFIKNGQSNKVGSLFGGSYQQPTNPFVKKGRKKGSKNK